MDARIAVVIPFYQHAPEPLVRALRSIFAQEPAPSTQVLIVDDGSPCPARSVVDRHFPGHPAIRVIEQPNGGAAMARNTGLASVPEAAEFIAFLDSDDEWTQAHLQRAMQAMTLGADMYFADHRRAEWETSKLAPLLARMTDGREAAPESGLFDLSGNVLGLILRDHAIQTSSVVLRRRVLGGLRFRHDLVLGEDEVLWIEAVRKSSRVLFSTSIEVEMGRGVNISQNLEGDLHRELGLAARNIYFWHRIRNYLPNEPDLASLRDQRLRDLERGFASLSLSALRRGAFARPGDLVQVTLARPRWLLGVAALLRTHVGTRLAPRR